MVVKILAIDTEASSRKVLVTRLREALFRAEIKRSEIRDGDFGLFSLQNEHLAPDVIFVGPGCYANLEESVRRLRALFPQQPLAVVLPNDVYAKQAVELRKLLRNVRFMPVADVAQMVQFLLDQQATSVSNGMEVQGGPIIGVVQLKGGVGTTSVAVGLSSCWATNGMKVSCCDFDDVSLHASTWGGLTMSARRATADMMRAGRVPDYRLAELLGPVADYGDMLSVVGPPEPYSEAFHLKADVLEDAPSGAEFAVSLVEELSRQSDIVVVDAGRTWGTAAFSLLPVYTNVLCVVDEDESSVERTLLGLQRFFRESDDPKEFDFSRWMLVVNRYVGDRVSLDRIGARVEQIGCFPDSMPIVGIPYSFEGRAWSLGPRTLYEEAEDSTRRAFSELAFNLAPFRQAEKTVRRPLGTFLRQLLS